MGSGYFTSPLMLIINTLFDIYVFLVLLRFLLQMTRADFYNPVSQAVVRMTTPPLRILRRFIPSIAGQDTSSIVLCLILIYIKFLLIRALSIPMLYIGSQLVPIASFSYAGLVVLCIADLIASVFTLYLIAIFIHIIMGWISPGTYNPALGLVDKIARPVLRPMQRIIPSIGGLDISPVFTILGLMVLKMLVVPPLIYIAGF